VHLVTRVTSGHVTNMAITPFDPPYSTTPCYTQTSWLYVLQNRIYCRSCDHDDHIHTNFTRIP